MSAIRRWFHAPDLPARAGSSLAYAVLVAGLLWARGAPILQTSNAVFWAFFLGWRHGRDDNRFRVRRALRQSDGRLVERLLNLL